MTYRVLGVLSVAALTLCSSALAKGPFGSVSVGNWKGGAFTDDASGQFTGCSAGATYLSGIYFMVSIAPDGGWSLGFVHQSWQLVRTEAFPIDFTFDGQTQFHVFGSALTTNLVRVPMPNNSALLAQFRKSKSMTALAKRQLYQFNLDGTSQLLPTLANCVASVKANGLANAGDFSIKPIPKPVAASAPAPIPAVGGSLTADSGAASSPELQIEAIELASNFILKTSLHGAKV